MANDSTYIRSEIHVNQQIHIKSIKCKNTKKNVIKF